MFSWLNNIYLFGLFLASLPILIHFLTRRKLKIIKFSSLRFIDEIQRTKMRSFKLKQILLLIIRTLIITFFVLAFARPAIRGIFKPTSGSHERTSVLILIDNSFSTSQEIGGIDIFTLEKDGARKIISLLKEGDEVSLCYFNESIYPLTNHFTRAFSRLDKIIDTLSVSYKTTNILNTLGYAKDEIKSAKNVNREIYILTDNRANGWTNFNIDKFKIDGARVFVLSYNGSEDNLGIKSISFPAQLIEINKPFSINYDVYNSNDKDYAPIVSNLFIDDKRIAQDEFTPVRNNVVSGELIGNVDNGGYHYGYVSIDNDALPVDDISYFSFKIPENLNVLLIGGPERIYLKLALAPNDSAKFFKINDITFEQAYKEQFDKYDVIILSSPPPISSDLLTRLKASIETGKGLLLFMGDKTDFKSWDNFFDSKVKFIGQVGQGSSYVNWGQVSYSHPIFNVFDPQKSLPQVNFYTFVQSNSQSGVIAQYSNNLPAIIESNIGEGKSIIFTSSVNPLWSSLYISGFFIPFLHRSVQYLAKDIAKFDKPIIVGENGSRLLENVNTNSRLTLIDPNGNKIYLEKKAWSGKIGVNLPILDYPGIYRIFDENSELVDLFSVNINPIESDLKPLEIKGKNDFIIINPQTDDINSIILSSRYGRELWKTFLIICFILMVLEILIATNWKQPKERE